MDVLSAPFQHPIILRIHGTQYRTASERLQFCTTQLKYDDRGFLVSFLIEIPRLKIKFAPERFRFERQLILSCNTLSYLIFTPCAVQNKGVERIESYLLDHLVCCKLKKQDAKIHHL